jgi:hypothetical protein
MPCVGFSGNGCGGASARDVSAPSFIDEQRIGAQ